MINKVADDDQISFQGDSYIHWINHLLQPKINSKLPVVVDLFAGCGGLSLGFEAQGFPTIGFENNTDAATTYSLNLQGECHCLTLKETTGEALAELAFSIPENSNTNLKSRCYIL